MSNIKMYIYIYIYIRYTAAVYRIYMQSVTGVIRLFARRRNEDYNCSIRLGHLGRVLGLMQFDVAAVVPAR